MSANSQRALVPVKKLSPPAVIEKNRDLAPLDLVNGNLSLHVLNIIDAIHNSAKKGKKVKINQLCNRPSVFSKKEIKNITK